MIFLMCLEMMTAAIKAVDIGGRKDIVFMP